MDTQGRQIRVVTITAHSAITQNGLTAG